MTPQADRERFIVRILRASGDVPAGVGFLVGGRRLITCAHVVNTALGRGPRAQERPSAETVIRVQFPLLDGERTTTRTARPASWTPPPLSGVLGGDVAGLLLDEPPPESARCARLLGKETNWGREVYLYGFPGDPPRRERGFWATGTLRGRVGAGVLQIDKATESALRTQPGYSGTPVVVVDGGDGDRVTGMLAVAGADSEIKDAYALSVHHLSECWPEASVLASHPGAHPAAQAFFRRRLDNLLREAPSACSLTFPEQISGEKWGLFRSKVNLEVARDDVLALWGDIGFLKVGVGVAFLRHSIVLRYFKTVSVPYADLPDYEVAVNYRHSSTYGRRYRGVKLVKDGISYEASPWFRGSDGWKEQNAREAMVKLIRGVTSLMTGEAATGID
ncbi:trypsin-like peptidase domain-containing protein [Streptomyces sp. PSRA5]|uniref:trypsin-like peptidase domain-containing protein n=1 Tax=Streptomyces panacea TaxID=3035064 RepID=UPI00339BBB64